MKRILFLSIIAISLLSSCADSLAKIDNTVKFEELKNAKVYMVFDSLGKPVMEADSIYKPMVVNGQRQMVKVGINERQKSYVGKDSLATFGPSGITVRRVLKLNPLKELRIIWGFVCIGLMIGLWVWAGIKKVYVARWGSVIFAVITGILFYSGMTAFQKKTYDAARNNSKTLSPEKYRHYFSKDPEGTVFWDSVYKRNGFIGL